MMIAPSRAGRLVVRAEKQEPSPASVYRKRVEAKRSTLLKENFTKLATIATADSKFLSDTFKELDVMHKEFFEKNFGRKKEAVEAEGLGEEEGADASIFLEADGEEKN